MLKKLVLSGMLACSLFLGGQAVYAPVASAEVQAGNVIVYEQSIQKTSNYIQVRARYLDAPHPMFLAFKQRSDGTGMYADAVLIDMGKNAWKTVSSSQMANDVLYVVLQYI